MTRSEAGKLGYIASIISSSVNKEKRIERYTEEPNKCNYCNKLLVYKKRRLKFCNSSCSASYNNEKRLPKVIAAKECNFCGKFHYGKSYCSHKCHREYVRTKAKNCWKNGEICNSPRRLRRFLIDDYGHKCWNCNLTEWMTNPIPLELEHIDGNSGNNIPENLKMLCPNCHALTPTYKSKNRGRGRHFRKLRYEEGKSY